MILFVNFGPTKYFNVNTPLFAKFDVYVLYTEEENNFFYVFAKLYFTKFACPFSGFYLKVLTTFQLKLSHSEIYRFCIKTSYCS